jgi:hypothetical protein
MALPVLLALEHIGMGNVGVETAESCPAQTIITDPKTFHIQIRSIISASPVIIAGAGKLVAIRNLSKVGKGNNVLDNIRFPLIPPPEHPESGLGPI